jgi:two-component system phosphate regulon sensor histidine kinase PhoR
MERMAADVIPTMMARGFHASPVFGIFGAAIAAGKHRVHVDLPPEPLIVHGDVHRLTQLLGNILNNAARYTPAGGKITLAWHDGPEGASFSVQDTGVGIAAEHIPRLTERFYRVDRSRSRETGGTGLGLAIVKHALSRHQATLGIESTLGAGSRFIARFPRSRTMPLESAAHAAAQ